MRLDERDERVAVVAVTVAGVHTGLAGDPLDRHGQIGVRPEHVGHLVGGVDEGEHPHAGELLAQGVHQQQGEVAEPGDRAGHVAQHHQFRARRTGLPQHHVDRHAAGGHRFAQRLAQVDRARRGPAPARGQPGGQRAGQWLPRLGASERSWSPEARRNSTFSESCGMPYIWTWSRPSCSAVRRLVSASTIFRSCVIRCAASALAICSWVGVGSSP